MTKRQVHLDMGATFLRCAWAFFLVRELVVWQWVRRFPVRPGIRLLVFLFKKWATPHSVLYALAFAALATIVLDLLVRLVLRPLVEHWHAPWTDGSAGIFHLSANEWVVASSPARRESGWRWPAGTLVRTNLRLWFFPRAHDAENWSCPLESLEEVRLEPAPRIAWGLIAGWPDRVVVQDDDGDVDNDGDEGRETFAVPDPDAVASWFPLAQASPTLSTSRRP